MESPLKRELIGASKRAGANRPRASVPGRERASKQTRKPCGTIWPNGEFGLGYMPSKEESVPASINLAGGVSLERLREECEGIAEGRGALDLTSLPNSHKTSNRPESYGRRGLSGYGGKMVRNAGHLMQERVGRKNLTFLTVTLPPMAKEDAVRVAESWPETVRQLIQWIGRQLEKAGLSTQVCAVTELQSKRLESGDAACLHLHAVFQGKRVGGSWVLSPKKIRAWWLKRLSSVTNGTIHSLNCVDTKRVKKDAGNYLSKYMSKGTDAIAKFAEIAGWDAVPRQWWNMNKPMREAIKRACLRSASVMTILDQMVSNHYAGDDEESFKFVRAIEVKATEYQSFVVGFWGRLRPPAVAELRELAGFI